MKKQLLSCASCAGLLGATLMTSAAFAQASQNANEQAVVAPEVPLTSASSQSPSFADRFNNLFGNRFKITGFASAGMSKINDDAVAANAQVAGSTLKPEYVIPGYGTVDHDFSFAPNSLVGLQVDADITKKWHAVLQLVADGDNSNGNKKYQVNAEWAYLRYDINPQANVKVGRFRIPLFLYSSTEQVGYSFPYTFLPPEVYRLIPYKETNGIDLIWNIPMGNTGFTTQLQSFYGADDTDYDIYVNPYANQFFHINGQPYLNKVTPKFKERNFWGVVGKVSNQTFTFRADYTSAQVSGTLDNPFYGMGSPSSNSYYSTPSLSLFGGHKKTVHFYSFGARYLQHPENNQGFLVEGEWGKRSGAVSLAALRGYYGTVGYRIAQFMPYVSYGNLKTTNKNQLVSKTNRTPAVLFGESAQAQDSYTLGLNYYFNKFVVGKLGVSRITPKDGTSGLFTVKPSKKHVNMYSISVDAIF